MRAYLIQEGLEDFIEPLYFGAWRDEEGKIYLDLNKHLIKFSHAIREGFNQKQKAIYDLKHNKSIYLKDVSVWEFLINE